jgi:DNA-directed RNA polymerase specialized sigma24 family protein
MSDIGSISLLLQDLREGDEAALAALHQRCWTWLVQTACKRLGGVTLRSVDEEDVAQEAFWGFVNSVRGSRVLQLETRHDLFALLTHIVASKGATQLERHLAAKRGGGHVRGESALDAREGNSSRCVAGLQTIVSKEGNPAEEAVLADCYQHYVSGLPDALRPVAELHLAGATNAEIADQLGVVQRTVERKLQLIRGRWQEMAAGELGTR